MRTKIPEEELWQCWNLDCMGRNSPEEALCYNCGWRRGELSPEASQLVRDAQDRIVGSVLAQLGNFTAPHDQPMVEEFRDILLKAKRG